MSMCNHIKIFSAFATVLVTNILSSAYTPSLSAKRIDMPVPRTYMSDQKSVLNMVYSRITGMLI
jgi:hypothetical protein